MKRIAHLIAVTSCCLALAACASNQEKQASAESKAELERTLAENRAANDDYARVQSSMQYQSQQMKDMKPKASKPDGADQSY